MAQDAQLNVVFEPFVGGRTYETSSDGTEYLWGEVTVWEPPSRVDYRWHVFLAPEKATTVSVTFTETDSGSIVRLKNSGFEVFGEAAPDRMSRVDGAWKTITGQYRNAF